MCLLFTITLKNFQHNILETSLTAKVIVSIIFSIKTIVFLKNSYVIIMSEDSPDRMRQIALFNYTFNVLLLNTFIYTKYCHP